MPYRKKKFKRAFLVVQLMHSETDVSPFPPSSPPAVSPSLTVCAHIIPFHRKPRQVWPSVWAGEFFGVPTASFEIGNRWRTVRPGLLFYSPLGLQGNTYFILFFLLSHVAFCAFEVPDAKNIKKENKTERLVQKLGREGKVLVEEVTMTIFTYSNRANY